jgi:hypothetical protein
VSARIVATVRVIVAIVRVPKPIESTRAAFLGAQFLSFLIWVGKLAQECYGGVKPTSPTVENRSRGRKAMGQRCTQTAQSGSFVVNSKEIGILLTSQ